MLRAFAVAAHHTFGVPVTVTRCTNNFGPFQYPEKAIPLFTTNALSSQTITRVTYFLEDSMAPRLTLHAGLLDVFGIGVAIIALWCYNFLNSKIVGWRIRNPLWLTLLGLIVGEKLMGVPGLILAPVLLNYIRLEASMVSGQGEPCRGKPSRGALVSPASSGSQTAVIEPVGSSSENSG